MRNIRNKNAPPNADLVQVYLSSTWDIVTEIYNNMAAITTVADAINDGSISQYLTASDIDTLEELNIIVTDANFGDFANQTQAEAGTDNTTTMTPLRTAQAIAAIGGQVKNTFNAAVNPTVDDDASEGYMPGSVWINIVIDPHESWRCSDNTEGAAVWVHTTLTADELATVATSGDSDDLIQGSVKLLMTGAERSKLTGIETAATADQTAGEIETAYQTQVPLISQAAAEAGTATDIESWSALRVAQAIAALGGGGGGVTKVGTPVNNEVAVWTGDGTLEGEAKVIFDGTNLDLDSNIIPRTTSVKSLGGFSKRWFGAYVDQITATNYIRMETPVLVTNLPVASLKGAMYAVSDATALTVGSIVAGGGSSYAMVYADGTNWRIYGGTSSGAVGADNKVITGTTYTVLAADDGYNLIFTNAAAIAVTLPDTLDTDFQATFIQTTAAGIPTVTRSGTDTINGAATGVAPAAQWKGMYLTQYAAGSWLALL